MSIKGFFIDLFFPQFCFTCQKEGEYLCSDCFSLLEILEYNFCLCEKPQRLPDVGKCKRCQRKKLNGLSFALPYQNLFAKKLIHKLKYNSPVKALSRTLASLIIAHFSLSEKPFKFSKDFLFIPIPLTHKKKKRRGFNQAEEIGKEVNKFFKITFLEDCLLKTKETQPQIELQKRERLESQKGVFTIKNNEKIKGKKILLVDDVYTTGATMEEAARVLKTAGAKEVWGLVVARG